MLLHVAQQSASRCLQKPGKDGEVCKKLEDNKTKHRMKLITHEKAVTCTNPTWLWTTSMYQKDTSICRLASLLWMLTESIVVSLNGGCGQVFFSFLRRSSALCEPFRRSIDCTGWSPQKWLQWPPMQWEESWSTKRIPLNDRVHIMFSDVFAKVDGLYPSRLHCQFCPWQNLTSWQQLFNNLQPLRLLPRRARMLTSAQRS